jgi:hypothetical protein
MDNRPRLPRTRRWCAGAAVAACGTAAVVLCTASSALADGQPAPGPTSSSQQVTVERPVGQVVLSDVSVDHGGQLAVTLTDTRADDPGWSVSVTLSSATGDAEVGWKPAVTHSTSSYADPDGTVYAQQVVAGPAIPPGPKDDAGIENAVLGSAPRGHGLGIAVLGAKLTAVGRAGGEASGLTVTVTVV